ncbi:hypothetical protein Vretimale_15058 [Volvox reticuliferus]|uniref:tRNA pseudouridine(55) synthase n=1 Tax=Volvox reticuliferus TaxID=1737510 RepID=A0A8J4LVA5_9CHLO|nr:hypothetical protein Vretifemale_16319 [Volvox reticuliferus]GIM11578.1 hypothetical protein Vretimale_15058 [Volvox reticuliferus]
MAAIISAGPVLSASDAFRTPPRFAPQRFPFPLLPPSIFHATCLTVLAPNQTSPHRRPQPLRSLLMAAVALAPPPRATVTSFRHCPSNAWGQNVEWEYRPSVSPSSAANIPPFCHRRLGMMPPPRRRRRVGVAVAVTARTPSAAVPPAAPLDPPTVMTSFPAHLHHNVLSNGLLIVDKPPHWEVAEVVTAVQRATRADKVASVAPLDAAASGLMLLCFGAATRLSSKVEKAAKRYDGAMVLGAAAASADVRGSSYVSEALPWRGITDEELQEAADGMLVALGAGSSSLPGSSTSDGTIIQILSARYRLRQYPSSFEYYEEDKGSSLQTVALNLHDFKVWRASEDEICRTASSTAVAAVAAGAKPIIRTAGAAAFAPAARANDPSDLWVSGAADTVSVSSNNTRQQPGVDEGPNGDLTGRIVRFSMLLSGRAHVRSVVAMYGRRLRTCTCLDELRRTEVGSFSVADAWPLEAVLPIMERYKR